MNILQPTYLWGLLAVAIPIAIHLWSRRKIKTIKVGSIQFINETKSKQSNSIQINEWLLLAIRCLIVGLVVLILARPEITTSPERKEIAYIFEPSLLRTVEGRTRFNNIPEEGRLLLAPGFPKWQDDDLIIDSQTLQYWQLAQELDNIAADSIVIFTEGFAKGLKGKRPTISQNVQWVPITSDDTVIQPLLATTQKDSITLFSVEGDNEFLAFAKAKHPKTSAILNNKGDSISITVDNQKVKVPLQEEKSLKVLLTFDAQTAVDTLYVKAALNAIASYTGRNIETKITEDLAISNETSVADYVIWLSEAPITQTIIPILLYRPDSLANKIIVPGDTRNSALLTARLTPETVIEKEFVSRLLQWMDLGKELRKELLLNDTRKIASSQLQTNLSDVSQNKQKVVIASMAKPLWILLLVFLVIERIIARIRQQ